MKRFEIELSGHLTTEEDYYVIDSAHSTYSDFQLSNEDLPLLEDLVVLLDEMLNCQLDDDYESKYTGLSNYDEWFSFGEIEWDITSYEFDFGITPTLTGYSMYEILEDGRRELIRENISREYTLKEKYPVLFEKGYSLFDFNLEQLNDDENNRKFLIDEIKEIIEQEYVNYGDDDIDDIKSLSNMELLEFYESLIGSIEDNSGFADFLDEDF